MPNRRQYETIRDSIRANRFIKPNLGTWRKDFVDVLAREVFSAVYHTKLPWGEEPWIRACGDGVCAICGAEFRRHPEESGPGYGFASDDNLVLQRLCSGKLVHL